jgi:beta-glucanase (GH16 family)
MPREHRWVFDGEMFLILNVAVGGWFGGDVDDSVFPQTMEVDYVRVYEANGE